MFDFRLLLPSISLLCCLQLAAQSNTHDLQFKSLPTQWDEALPLGNGMLGALVWQKDNHLRFSLDRADLWDERPMKGLHRKEFSYAWVQQQVARKDYSIVQQYFDDPYEAQPAPSKIPGAALDFVTADWGCIDSSGLDIQKATAWVHWHNGIVLKSFVHATQTIGWFRFEQVPDSFHIQLTAPSYQGMSTMAGNSVRGDDLSRLGYPQGTITETLNRITYIQKGWNGFHYRVTVRWKRLKDHIIEGVWTISSSNTLFNSGEQDDQLLKTHLSKGFGADYSTHQQWWHHFWSASAIYIPDSLIEKQWYLEQYKFGSASKKGAPPISLQAIWTADNGRLPPWKGDYHHDLNTQLSYWPSYSANHLEEAMAYLDHLDQNKKAYKQYTRSYFGTAGLAVPGVTTLNGTEMGGWIQYALSPTISAWLAQHYYLQWKYSMDPVFLKKRAYPWIRDVAVFLESITRIDQQGYRKLPISSSPEINDNNLSAWFDQNTNYDLALMKFNFSAASELATELGLIKEAAHWDSIYHQLPGFALTASNEMKFSPVMAYTESHRHFSHLMAIFPLGIIRWEDGEPSRSIIRNSIHLLDSIGPANWCGYSYAWLANLNARAKDGVAAAKALHIFAQAFCSVNSFHLNGDQSKSGYSNYQYRPFTLEGNFAFASGVQEMLLQSYGNLIQIMPAIPESWRNLSFKNLRAESAFRVSATRKEGCITSIRIISEKGGIMNLKMNTYDYHKMHKGKITILEEKNGLLKVRFQKGAILDLVS